MKKELQDLRTSPVDNMSRKEKKKQKEYTNRPAKSSQHVKTVLSIGDEQSNRDHIPNFTLVNQEIFCTFIYLCRLFEKIMQQIREERLKSCHDIIKEYQSSSGGQWMIIDNQTGEVINLSSDSSEDVFQKSGHPSSINELMGDDQIKNNHMITPKSFFNRHTQYSETYQHKDFYR